jgi:hypothetical protein
MVFAGRVKPHKSYHPFFLVDAESAAPVGELRPAEGALR